MGVIKNFMVRVGADFSPISKQSTKAQQSMSKMQSSVTKSCSRMTASVSGMNKILSRLGVTLSTVAFTAFAKNAKEAYEVQEIAETKLATVMRQRMSASDEEIKKIYELTAAQQKLGVIGDEIQLTGAQQLSTFLKETDSLKVLIPAMNNLVAQQKGLNATTGDAYTVANMMGKAMQGQYTALRRVGITFTDAEAAVLKYGNEAQRAAMLAQIITNNVGQMNQSLAATPSGRLKQVANTLGDIKEQFGSAVTNALTVFLPVMNAICSVLATMANLASRVAQAIANVFGRSASTAASTVSYTAAAADSMEDLADATNAAGSAGSKAKKSLGTFGFDTLQKLSSSGSSGGSGGSGGAGVSGGGASEQPGKEAGESVGWLEKGLNKLKKTIDSLDFNPLKKSFENLRNAAKPLVDTIINGLGWAFDNILVPIASWEISAAIPASLDVLSGALSVLSSVVEAFKPLGKWLYDKFLYPIGKWYSTQVCNSLKKLAERLDDISEWIRKNNGIIRDLVTVLNWCSDAWEYVSDAVGKWTGCSSKASQGTSSLSSAMSLLLMPINLIFAPIEALVRIVELLTKAFDTVKTTGKTAWDGILSVWKPAASWFNSTVLPPVVNGFSSAWASVSSFATGAWSKASAAWKGANSWFSSNVTSPIRNTFRSFANGIIGFFESMINAGIRGVNKLISGVNKISFKVPAWVPGIGGRSMGFNISSVPLASLPRLATGAVFEGNNPYLAVVNDQKHGINIESPLSTIIEAMNTALRENGGAGGQFMVENHVSFEGSLAALARALAPAIISEIKRTGNSASSTPIKVGG